MPHCVIEYSRGITGQIEIDALLDAVHRGTMDSNLFPEYDVKTRALGYEHHRTGQTRDSFVHIAASHRANPGFFRAYRGAPAFRSQR